MKTKISLTLKDVTLFIATFGIMSIFNLGLGLLLGYFFLSKIPVPPTINIFQYYLLGGIFFSGLLYGLVFMSDIAMRVINNSRDSWPKV